MNKFIVSCCICFVLCSTGCTQTKSPANSPVNSSNQESVDGSSIDQKQAREFSDSVVKTIIRDNQNELRQKMEQAFRDKVSEKDMNPMLEKVYATYGKPLEVEFKMDEIGYRISDTGERKPMRKFWYAVRTTKQMKEQQFLFTEIVADGGSLACAIFSIVTFPNGVPPGLK